MKFQAYTTHWDVDTGQQISERTAKNDYYLIYLEKKQSLQPEHDTCYIEYRKQYKKSKQLKLYNNEQTT